VTKPATPLNNAYQGGLFFMSSQSVFNKSPTTIAQQIDLLQRKGLIVNSITDAASHLSNIGYFRFITYCRAYQKQRDNGTFEFKDNIHFDQIINLYDFDRQLRLLTLDAIERIEIAFRAKFNHEMALSQGNLWYAKPELFRHEHKHLRFLKELTKTIERKDKPYIKNYYQHYNLPELPPCWMIGESLSFGTWSQLFENLALRDIKKSVANQFKLPFHTLTSWLRALTDVRNVCAHHERLWNTYFPRAPEKVITTKVGHRKFYQMTLVMSHLLHYIDANNEWLENLINFLHENNHIRLRAMGFEDNWEQRLKNVS